MRSETDGSKDFYDGRNQVEQGRLKDLAEFPDKLSVGLVRFLSGGFDGAVVVIDAGSGPSTSLGTRLQNELFVSQYIPVDTTGEYVELQRQTHPNATEASVTDMAQRLKEKGLIHPSTPEVSTMVIVHERFVGGWLSRRDRLRQLGQIIEIVNSAENGTAGLVTMDYDWSQVNGPNEFMDVVNCVKKALRLSGFNPEHGAIATREVKQMLNDFFEASTQEGGVAGGGGDDIDLYDISENVYSFQQTRLEDAMDSIIAKTVESVLEHLRQAHMLERADELQCMYDKLRTYSNEHPNEKVQLPSIVATTVKFHRQLTLRDDGRLFSALTDPKSTIRNNTDWKNTHECVFPGSLDNLPPVYIVTGEDKGRVDACRVQAVAYWTQGIVTAEAINPRDGTLIEKIDPREIRDERAIQFIASRRVSEGDIHELPRAGIRIVTQNGRGIGSLPAIARMHSAGDNMLYNAILEAIYTHVPQEDIANLGEISGLFKNPDGGKSQDVIAVICALVSYSQQKNINWAVMDLDVNNVKRLYSLFGEDAFIDPGIGDHTITLDGVSGDHKFRTLIVCLRDFFPKVEEYLRSGDDSIGAAFKHIEEALRIVVVAPPQHSIVDVRGVGREALVAAPK